MGKIDFTWFNQETQAMKNLKIRISKIFFELLELAKRRRRLNLADLRGKVRFAEGYDYKAMRKGR